MKRSPRLRWQLTLSHLIAVAVTLVSMIGAIVLLVLLVVGPHVSPGGQPVQDARTIAAAVGGLVEKGDPSAINGALRTLADPSFRLPNQGAGFGRPAQFGGASSLQNIAYIALVGPGGRELASSDPAGAGLSPPERGEWAAVTDKALAGDTMASELLATRRGAGPAALAAYPVVDAAGHPLAAVLVAVTSIPAASSGGFSLSQALAIFGAASVAVLLAASLFALASSSLVAYLLARRVVRRLERLGEAAQALAAGDLAARVEEGARDEMGELARRFNQMAADLQRTLDQLREERDRVSGLLKARRELVASVSHELRTPVATIRGYLESALSRISRLPGEVRADLETSEAEIGRLQRLIDDLFTLSRAEVGRLELRLETTDVGEVVRQAVGTLAPLAWTQRKVQVVAETASGLAVARADSERLRQVLSNLLSNAIRHTPPGGLVAAAGACDGGVIRVEVRDTGGGIAAEELPHVFERFYRGSNGDVRDGAGLGLAVAQELIEVMGGSLDVESVAGEGCCFTIRLPRA